MSEMEYKMVLRAKLPHIRNREDHLELFHSVLGEPAEIEEYAGKVEWFTYERWQDRGKHYPKYVNIDHDGVFGVECVLQRGTPDAADFSVSLRDLRRLWNKMCKDFAIEHSDVHLHTYSWYNGVDEPVVW